MPARRPKGEGKITFNSTRNRYIGVLPAGVERAGGLPKEVSATTKSECAEKLRDLRVQHADALAALTVKQYEPITVTELIAKFSGTTKRVQKHTPPPRTVWTCAWRCAGTAGSSSAS